MPVRRPATRWRGALVQPGAEITLNTMTIETRCATWLCEPERLQERPDRQQLDAEKRSAAPMKTACMLDNVIDINYYARAASA